MAIVQSASLACLLTLKLLEMLNCGLLMRAGEGLRVRDAQYKGCSVDIDDGEAAGRACVSGVFTGLPPPRHHPRSCWPVEQG